MLPCLVVPKALLHIDQWRIYLAGSLAEGAHRDIVTAHLHHYTGASQPVGRSHDRA